MPEITPWRLTPEITPPNCNLPEEEPPLDVHTPEITRPPWVDTESADRDRRRSRRHIYSPPPPPGSYIKKFAADTKAYSLITRFLGGIFLANHFASTDNIARTTKRQNTYIATKTNNT